MLKDDLDRNIRLLIPLILESIHDKMLAALGRVNASVSSTTHLRIGFFLPYKGLLKLSASYNMDDDADKNMELGFHSGAVGRCWQQHEVVIADLTKAKETYNDEWNMNSAQQKLVRSTLKSLLCVPIFDLDSYDENRLPADNPLIGVMTIDSDELLLNDFQNRLILQEARVCAGLIARALRGELETTLGRA